MPPRTKETVDAEKATKKAQARAERDAAELHLEVTLPVGRTLVWSLEQTSGRAGLELWRQSRLTVNEVRSEITSQGLSGHGVEPFVIAAVAFLAAHQAGVPATFDGLLDQIDSAAIRSGEVSLRLSDAPPKA